MKLRISQLLVATAALAAAVPLASAQQPAATPAKTPASATAREPGNESPWPLVIQASGDTKLTLYQPQLDAWDGFSLQARLAVRADIGKDKPQSQFGSITLSARTLTDKGTRTVTLSEARVAKADFPSASTTQAQGWVNAIGKDFQGKTRVIALDRLEAGLALIKAEKPLAKAPLRNDPPRIVFSDVPAVLVSIDGEPIYRDVTGTLLQRAINTRPLLLRDKAGGFYLKVFDGWMAAGTLAGPWKVGAKTPELEKAFKDMTAAHAIDPLTGQGAADQPAPKLADKAPAIYVATKPTEVVVTDGAAKFEPIAGTKLQYVSNTTGSVFQDTSSNRTYILVAGRWFTGDPKSADGWTYVASNALPPDFAKIPDDSPKENVKASIAGTTQAREAAIAADIPQVASVKLAGTKLTDPKLDGDFVLKPIDGTPLSYVANSPTPIIKAAQGNFFAVENGVWFQGPAVRGPWKVATAVPTVIYTIPPSSPLHYVTYVRVFGATPEVVYVGYTPGYQGTVVDPATGVVVYGTGYTYDPWVGTYWYGAPVTYGYGAAVAYTPWTGWAVTFGFGMWCGAYTTAWGYCWGAYPYWGPWGYPAYYGVAYGVNGGAVAWGPGGWAGYTGNIYSQWGNRAQVSRYAGGYNAWTGNAWAGKAGASYNSRTGIASAGQRGAVGNVYTGNYAAGQRGVAGGDNFAVAGRSGTAGNAYTGDSISGKQGVIYNKNTGEVTKYGGITGQDGGKIGRVGDDVYAGKDGNIYRNTGDGWQKHEAGGGWNDVGPSAGQHNLDGERQARQFGNERAGQMRSSNMNARSFHGGGGFRGRR
ncbi:hypothetical protein DSM104443_01896 [Usitatibacter rugosus]|uniref:Autotransporter n=1 Tax=Usitatibacter rugosus TaxID=2732067 RepID=A0A6M4GUM4_9PROT|nr:autotransporter [Usitatibacter rugosus]QJR10826.1 hypothetical protein DSM104443_01896 [Usitatibacter rugosus]